MTEEDVRRIFREELQKALPQTEYRGIPLPPNAPLVPLHPGFYPYRPNTSDCAIIPGHGVAV